MSSAQVQTRPRRKRIRLPIPDYRTPGAWYFLTICCKGKKPLFHKSEVRTLVVGVLRETAQCHKIEVAGYTVLPDHLHLICSAGRAGIIAFVRHFKGRVAAEMRKSFGTRTLWQGSFFDRKLRSEESLREKCIYVWQNPVRRGLVEKSEDYAWSGSLRTG
ncbi:MAG: transposase [Terriglobia bacterium]